MTILRKKNTEKIFQSFMPQQQTSSSDGKAVKNKANID